MAKAIKIKDIAQLIHKDLNGKVESGAIRFSFSRFSNILYKNEICTDPRTVKLKWDILKSKGVIHQLGKTEYELGALDIWAFNDEWPEYSLTVMLPKADTHTAHTHSTHTAEGVSE